MKLELDTYHIKEVQFSRKSELEDGVLYVNKSELEAFLSQDDKINSVKVDLAMPGEKTRIIHILDIVEPRVKIHGPGCIFPGFLGPPRTVGEGRTNRLAGVAVIETGEFPRAERGVLFQDEKVIDMSGPGALYSPFAKTLNVVLNVALKNGLPLEDCDQSIRLAGLKTARYLAELTRNVQPDQHEIFELADVSPSLPRIAYVYQVMAAGILMDTYLYGTVYGGLPTVLHPNEPMDGAIVSGVYRTQVSTYIHSNNRVITELYSRHGKELNFVGVIFMSAVGSTLSTEAKERAAYFVAKLCKLLKASGVVLTQESGGHSMMDQMLTCQACEEFGVKTTVVTWEMCGETGADSPLIYSVPKADAIVSIGNREEKILLPSAEKVIGGNNIFNTELNAQESFQIFVNQIAGSVDQTGFSKLRAQEY